MGKSNGNRYGEEFRQGAVKLVLENKQSIAEACRNLGVSIGTMKRWLAVELNNHDAEKIRLRQLGEENRQLWKDKADLEDTVDILKKRQPSSVGRCASAISALRP
ncbi:MAG: transposase [Ethanoligenens sp.]